MKWKRNATLADRFWAYAEPGPGCWGWRGKQFHQFGYPRFKVLDGGRIRLIAAHRLSWELHFGPIPAGMSVLHHCDNPPCTKPEHLFLGTQGDNLRDRDAKGRTGLRASNPPCGSENPFAKLTDDDVAAIRGRYRRYSRDANSNTLAAEFGVSQFVVWAIVHRRMWKHLANP